MGQASRPDPFVFFQRSGQYCNLQLGYAESHAFQRVSIISLVFRNQNRIFSKVFTHIPELFNYSRCIWQCTGFKKLGTRRIFFGRIFCELVRNFNNQFSLLRI